MTTKNKIVLVSFPFDDLSAIKIRPAVCLTDPIGPHRHVVFAFITSHIPARPLPTDPVLESTDLDFRATGLLVSSTIQLHRLMTGATVLIQRELGSVPPRFQSALDQRLRRLFGLK
ncbi:MAG: growth inhibitor PemK [Chloroflexi bacterium HGW-Chloroflexi-1]|nr:MAG: growth inhibitor PemK [Chloroflexi bacterium HGW-Chloroflexi-1]